jgi:hypothetical protein
MITFSSWENREFLVRSRGWPSGLEATPFGIWVPVCELEGEGGENILDVSPVLEISRTEETRAELPVREAGLSERLGDGRLPGPRETVQPEHTLEEDDAYDEFATLIVDILLQRDLEWASDADEVSLVRL